MPLSKLQFRPGVNRESTTYANEGGYYDSDKVRFRSGFPEKIGGWVNLAAYISGAASTFKGVARSMWNWITLSFSNLNAVGTNQKLYVEDGGLYHDITPIASTVTLGSDPFSVTSGSKLVTVTSTSHGATAGTFVTYSGASTVGSLNLNAEFEIISVLSSNSYTIISSTAASSTTTGGGASVSAAYQLSAGQAVYTSGTGWGAGGWGRGTWGSAATISAGAQLQLWSMDNFGQDLITAPRGGAIYYWAVDTTSYARAVLLSSIANSTTQYTSSATYPVTFLSGASSITITADTATYVYPGVVISGTGIAAGTYVTTAYVAGSLTVPISANTTLASSGNYTFSYSGRMVPNSTYQVMASDIQRFVIAFGANPYDPTNFSTTFDPLLVRWSDQENPYNWIPTAANQAGELRLSSGSRIVTGLHTRQENLVFTDSALFSMQYVGPPYVWGFSMLADNLSIVSPNAVITANNITYWMGVDKFYMYSGRVETLPCTLRQYVFGDINLDQAYQIVCGTNEGYNEIWWFYPSAGSNVNNRYVIYNHLERIWYYGNIHRSAWLDSPLRQHPMGSFSVQNSYLNVALTGADTDVTLIDTTSYPASGTIQIDSEVITYTGNSGSTLTGCTRGALGTTATTHSIYTPVTYYVPNQVMYHEDGVDDYSNLTPLPIESYIQSSDFDIGDGHNFGFVWRMLPDVTFSGSTAANPSVTLTVRPRQNSGTNYGAADSPTVTRTATYPVEQYTGQVYTRLRGRQMAFKISSTDLGVTWQLGSPRIDIRPDGRR